VNLRRRAGGPPLLIGHRGAKAAARENSREALEAAVAAGVDLVEFDVAPGLVLAHSVREAAPDALSLDEALRLLAPHGVGLHVDVKRPGYEQAVLEAVDRHGLRERVLVSTAFAAVSRRVAALAPDVPRAIGYPRDRYGVSSLAWPERLTAAGAAALRAAMPARIPLLLGAARANVLALHHTLCSRAAVATAHRLGAPVLAWTVNDDAAVQRVLAAGVDGIVSDDPESLRATLSPP
jgi:glycerophosphoryl diester phosphodiesterase